MQPLFPVLKVIFTVILVTCLFGCTANFNENPFLKYENRFLGEFPYEFSWLRSLRGTGWIENDLKLAPFFNEDKFIVYTRNTIVAYSTDKGNIVWTIQPDSDIASPIRLEANEKIGWFTTIDGRLLSVSMLTGEMLASIDIGEVITPLVIADNNILYARSISGKLSAVDTKSKQVLWVNQFSVPTLSLRGASKPVLLDGGVAVLTDACTLFLYRASDGLTIWEYQINNPKGITDLERIIDGDATPTLFRNNIITVCYNGKMNSINLVNRQQDWDIPISSRLTPLEYQQSLITVTDNSEIVRVSMVDGSILWRNKTLVDRRVSTPIIDGNLLLVGDYDGFIHLIDLTTGVTSSRRQFFCSAGGALDEKSASPVANSVVAGCKQIRHLTLQDNKLLAVDEGGLLMVFEKKNS